MKKLFCCASLFVVINVFAQTKRQFKSPDGQIRITIETGKNFLYSVYFHNQPILISSAIDMQLANGVRLSKDLTIRKISLKRVNDSIMAIVPEKRKIIPDIYNEMTIQFHQRFSIILRAYNDGFAYRIKTHFQDSLFIENEKALFNFAGNYPTYYPEVQKRPDMDIFHTSFEEPYQLKPLDSIIHFQSLFYTCFD